MTNTNIMTTEKELNNALYLAKKAASYNNAKLALSDNPDALEFLRYGFETSISRNITKDVQEALRDALSLDGYTCVLPDGSMDIDPIQTVIDVSRIYHANYTVQQMQALQCARKQSYAIKNKMSKRNNVIKVKELLEYMSEWDTWSKADKMLSIAYLFQAFNPSAWLEINGSLKAIDKGETTEGMKELIGLTDIKQYQNGSVDFIFIDKEWAQMALDNVGHWVNELNMKAIKKQHESIDTVQ